MKNNLKNNSANQPTNNLSYSLNRPQPTLQANPKNRPANCLKRYLNRITKDNKSIILYDKETNQNEKSS